jgi:drug/metabolite transporter (DMT)-like permease
MHWFLLALGAPVLWAISNHIDKYLIGRYARSLGIGALVLFSAAIGMPIALAIPLLGADVLAIGWLPALVMVGSGALFIVSLLPYMYALQHEDASNVVPAFQTIPLFGFILAAAFLGESLTGTQVTGGLLIVGAAVAFMLQPGTGTVRVKPLLQMLLASAILATTNLLFKLVAIEASYWVTAFWQYVGYAAAGVALVALVPTYRREFVAAVRTNTSGVLALNAINEIISAVGVLLLAAASLMAPLALVQLVNGLHPVFAFLIGLGITLLVPKLGREDIGRATLLRKAASLAVLLAGVYLINR